ncbi:REP-associated tyrosine transposase [Rhodohalobacter sp.]|uniref:REP-associated tyrosine transposase n=1 Tax=Rhodohalobacter sp. TaxID=1974210 RepID=UPI002ACEB4DA|nr:transposase [Rhodohalobacter sp.]MDZ7758111.1 transposase [Rhodohalobacter sp.]
MSRSRYRVYDSDYPYFITSSIVEGYPVFSNPLAAQVILDALEFIQNKRSTIVYAYVIMENHIHMVIQDDKLPQQIQAFKSWTARAIIDLFSDNGHYLQLHKLKKAKNPSHVDSVHQLWQEGFYPKQIFDDKMMIQKIEYIHNNPVKRGFVDQPEEWRYSSARNYLGMESLVPVTLFEL